MLLLRKNCIVLIWSVWLFCISTCLAFPAWAQKHPNDLKPWIPYVEKKKPQRWCPLLQEAGARICVFGSPLLVRQEAQRLWFDFEVENKSLENVWVELPRIEAQAFSIESLRINGKEEVAKKRIDGEQVSYWWSVPAGVVQKISFQIPITSPQGASFSVKSPEYIPWVSLQRSEGKSVVIPSKEEVPSNVPQKEELVKMKVYRKVMDGSVFRVQTYLELENINNKEKVFSFVAKDEGGRILSMKVLQNALRIEEESMGRYRMHVPPGVSWVMMEHAFDVSKKSAPLNLKLPFEVQGAKVQAGEVWVLQKDHGLRDLKPMNAKPIDARQLPMTLEASNLPAFETIEGISLEIIKKETSAGSKESRFSAQSHIWVSMNGSEVIFKQQLHGEEPNGGTYPSIEGWSLSQMRTNGKAEALFEKDGKSYAWLASGAHLFEVLGVQSRQSLHTLEVPRSLLVGVNVENLSEVHVHLPPGWRALWVKDAESAQALFNRLTLWDWFVWFLIIWTLVALFHWKWGVLLGGGIFVGLLQENALFKDWLWFLLVVALLPKLPEGKFKKSVVVLFVSSSIFLGVLIGKFAYQNIQMVLYPSLQYYCPGCLGGGQKAQDANVLAQSPRALSVPEVMSDSVESVSSKSLGARTTEAHKAVTPELDSSRNHLSISGIGEPKWSFGGLEIQDQQRAVFKVYLLPYGANALLALLASMSYLLLCVLSILKVKKCVTGERNNSLAPIDSGTSMGEGK